MSPLLVGRQSERDAVCAAYARAAEGRTVTVLITGEAGIGKTTLVETVVADLPGDPLVLIGDCLELGGGLPYQPFLDLRALTPRNVPRPVTDGESRATVVRRFLDELRAVIGSRPAVVVVEDLHWSDETTRDLFVQLARALRGVALLLIGTLRTGELAAGHPVRQLAGELGRRADVSTIALGPLTRAEAGQQLTELARLPMHPARVAEIHRRAGGNPFFVAALGTAADPDAGDLRTLLLDRVAQLPVQARHVLDVAAVAGAPMEDDVLAAAAELSAPDLAVALRVLTDRGHLVVEGARHAVRHDLLREAVLSDLPPLERRRLHRRFATALTVMPSWAAGDRSLEIAVHWAEAGDPHEALPAAWRASATARARTAYDAELAHLQAVLRWWDAVPAANRLIGEDRTAVVVRAVRAALQAGDDEAGLELARSLLDDRDLAPVVRADVLGLLARLENRADLGGRQAIEAALRLVPPGVDDAIRCRVLAFGAVIALPEHRLADIDALAAESLQLADVIGDHGSAAWAHLSLAWPRAMAGDLKAATEHCERAVAAADRAGEAVALVSAHQIWATVLTATGALEEGLLIARAGASAAELNGLRRSKGPMLSAVEAEALTELGRWDEAVEVLDDALADRAPSFYNATLALKRAVVAVARGELPLARALVDEIADVAQSSPHAEQGLYDVHRVAMELALAEGDLEAANLLVDRVLAHSAELHALAQALDRVVVTALRVQTARRLNAPRDRAATDGRRNALIQLLDRVPAPTSLHSGSRLTVVAERTNRLGDWDAAASGWATIGNPHEQAWSLLGAVRSALTSSNKAGASRRLSEAEQLAEQLGAVPLTQRIAELRTRAGLRRPSVRAGTPFGLTDREIEVLRGLAQGASNRQIAADLYLSVNTVSAHVRRIFVKLSVTSRAAATAVAYEHNLVPPGPASP
ncbi:helix-turn-helix transcriptional regulator [Kribbella sp. NPDC056345]|uniref:helix-turn-helix transcriptional regulator n=1 Tax=Kribbella sp. NPDC056345 TaxID=3345789 RepID=UPI0035DF463D